MTVIEMFEKYEDEYLEFNRIPENERVSKSNVLCGLVYLYNLAVNPERFRLEPAHDIIYIDNPGTLYQELTEEDVIYLRRCGIHYCEEYDSLAMFT